MTSNQPSYKIHTQLLYNFVIESLKNRSLDGNLETLAYVSGHIQNGVVISHDLVYPRQRGSVSNVDDLGKRDVLGSVFFLLI